jgi:hypothetical protein
LRSKSLSWSQGADCMSACCVSPRFFIMGGPRPPGGALRGRAPLRGVAEDRRAGARGVGLKSATSPPLNTYVTVQRKLDKTSKNVYYSKFKGNAGWFNLFFQTNLVSELVQYSTM